MIDGPSLFTPWESFYVIVGSSGAALTGLQFVVMALIAEADRKGSSEAVSAFGTPTVVHFCMVLAASAILSAPWRGTLMPGSILGAAGAGGLAYAAIVTARAGRQKAYTPVFEDWLWHSILPIIAYTLLVVGAIAVARGAPDGLFAIAGTALTLLFVGIHNAWDSVAFIAMQQYNASPPSASPRGTRPQG